MKRSVLQVICVVFISSNLLSTRVQDEKAKSLGAKQVFYNPSTGRLYSPARSEGVELDELGRRRIGGRPRIGFDEPVGLSYWIELLDDSGFGRPVTNARLFRSGERIRLHFRSNTDGYICLAQLGPSGQARMIYPDLERGLSDNRLMGDRDTILPGSASWFRFDTNAGLERIFVFFSRDASDLDSADPEFVSSLMRHVERVRDSKDLVIETEESIPSEVGTYAVNMAGEPVGLEIRLTHR